MKEVVLPADPAPDAISARKPQKAGNQNADESPKRAGLSHSPSPFGRRRGGDLLATAGFAHRRFFRGDRNGPGIFLPAATRSQAGGEGGLGGEGIAAFNPAPDSACAASAVGATGRTGSDAGVAATETEQIGDGSDSSPRPPVACAVGEGPGVRAVSES